MKLLNAGCGTHYASGWVNVDVWRDETTQPDVLTVPGQPYPFDDDTFDAVFLGHVLEHIPWRLVVRFLQDMVRVAKPGAPILLVGPDVYRTLKEWQQGVLPWWLVESVMEHADVMTPNSDGDVWEGAPHHWNCHESRVMNVLKAAGLTGESYTERVPWGSSWYDDKTDIVWPVVGYERWQFAIMTHAN